jgi:hypothetical protein
MFTAIHITSKLLAPARRHIHDFRCNFNTPLADRGRNIIHMLWRPLCAGESTANIYTLHSYQLSHFFPGLLCNSQISVTTVQKNSVEGIYHKCYQPHWLPITALSQDMHTQTYMQSLIPLKSSLAKCTTHRDVLQEALHRWSFSFQEVIHEFHKVLLSLKAREVGQCLQCLGHKSEITCSLLIWIFCNITIAHCSSNEIIQKSGIN